MSFVQPEKKAQNNVEICKPCLMGKFNCKRELSDNLVMGDAYQYIKKSLH